MACHQSGIAPVIVKLALLAASLSGALDAQSTTANELWPELNLYVGMNAHTRFFFQYTATRENNLDTYADGQVGGYFDFFMAPLRYRLPAHPDRSRDKLLMFRIGYVYYKSPASGSKAASVSQIPTIEATSKFRLPGDMLLSDRNRGDLRITNSAWNPRFRNRLKLERTFKAARFQLTPYFQTEVFYEWKYDRFDEFRYQPGMEWSIAHFLLLDVYYTRQHTTESSPNLVNALGAKLEFFVRNKR